MFVRSLRVRGRTYYQVVRAVRVGARVDLRVVLALGRTPSLTAALRGMKARLDALKLRRSELPTPTGLRSRTLRGKIDTLDARIAGLRAKVEMLTEMIENKTVKPFKRKGK
jgi:hypothetical protein